MADRRRCKNFLEVLKESRYAVLDRSLRHWKQLYHEGRHAVLAHRINPHSKVLTEEHKLLIARYILRCLDVNEPKDNLGVWTLRFPHKRFVWSREALVSAVRPEERRDQDTS